MREIQCTLQIAYPVAPEHKMDVAPNARNNKSRNLLVAGAGVVGALLFGGYAAPLLIKAFAAPGLFGASATSSGLAALGGGSLAAGGLGMAGGTTILGAGAVATGAASAVVADKVLD